MGDRDRIPGLGRSPGGGHGNQLQYSCLENPHGQRSLAAYSPWGHKEVDTAEQRGTAQQSTRNVCERKAGREGRGKKGNKGNERKERKSCVAGENRATRDGPQQDSTPHARLSTLRRFETTVSSLGPTPSTGLMCRAHHQQANSHQAFFSFKS